MNQKVAQALNEQVIFEFNAASTYLALSLAMADANFKGFSAWLRAQYQEEVTHAFKFIDYLQSNNEKVTLGDVKNTASKPIKKNSKEKGGTNIRRIKAKDGKRR